MPDTIITPVNVFSRAYAAAGHDDVVLLGLFPTVRPEKFGMVRFKDDKEVIEIIDKPKKTDLKYMWGFIIWRPAFTEHLHQCVVQEGIVDFSLIMNKAITKGMKFRAILFETGNYQDLGTYEEIMAFEKSQELIGSTPDSSN